MDLIKLLDVANPKKTKDTINALIQNYDGFEEHVQDIAVKAAEDSAAALLAGNEAKQIAQDSATTLLQSITQQNNIISQNFEEQNNIISQNFEEQNNIISQNFEEQNNIISQQNNIISQNFEEQNEIIAQNTTTSSQAKQIAEEALAMIEAADVRSEEATALAEQAIETAEGAVGTSELAMNVATEAKSTVDQAISTGVFGTFVYNTDNIALQRVYATDLLEQENTEDHEYLATPKLVRDALNNIDLSNYVDLTSEQTVPGTKSFDDLILNSPNNNGSMGISNTSLTDTLKTYPQMTLFGCDVSGTGDYATAFGYAARASAWGTAVGRQANAFSSYTVAIGYNASASGSYNTSIGYNASSDGTYCTVIGSSAQATSSTATAIGDSARVQGLSYWSIAIGTDAAVQNAKNAIQLGIGTNSTANTLQVGSYTLLDTSTGLIPNERINSDDLLADYCKTDVLDNYCTLGVVNDILTNYYTKNEVYSNYCTKEDIDSNYYTKEEIDSSLDLIDSSKVPMSVSSDPITSTILNTGAHLTLRVSQNGVDTSGNKVEQASCIISAVDEIVLDVYKLYADQTLAGNERSNTLKVNLDGVFINNTAIVNSGTTTNGYWVRFYDGTQICYGRFTSQGTYTHTLPMPFINTNYTVTLAIENSTSSSDMTIRGSSCTSKTTTSFTKGTTSGTFDYVYLAIGSWK